VEPGDLVAIPVSGAYQLSMSSNYNGAARPAVLWLADGQALLIQRRETADDLLRRDQPLQISDQ
jgi:diaminopimelate decarboxylase